MKPSEKRLKLKRDEGGIFKTFDTQHKQESYLLIMNEDNGTFQDS
jgi:hypothetical protein